MTGLTVTLTGVAADKLRKLVAEEHYQRAEDAVSDALDALEASRDPELDAWLRGAIKSRAEAFAADPSRSMTAEQVRAHLLER